MTGSAEALRSAGSAPRALADEPRDLAGDPPAADALAGDAPAAVALLWPGEVTLDDILAASANSRPHDPADLSQLPADLAEDLRPGPELAQWLAAVSPGQLDDFHLAGVAASWRRLAAWAQARELATVAEIAARSASRDTSLPIEADGSPKWVPSGASDEVALALCMSRVAAACWVDVAVTLSWRLPETLIAMSSGEIDLSRARLIAEATSVLDLRGARAVQDKVLVSAGRQTLGQLRACLRRAVISVDPDAAERRRVSAERKAKVELYGDEEGTASLSGQNLPGAQSAAAMARLTALARAMQAAGADGGLDLLRAKAFLGLLLGTLPLIPPAEGPDPAPPADPPGPAEGPADPPSNSGHPPDRAEPAALAPAEPANLAVGSAGHGGHVDGPAFREPGGPSRWDTPWPGLPSAGGKPSPGCAPACPPAESSPPDGSRPRGKVIRTVNWLTLAGMSGEPGKLCWLGPVTPQTAWTLARAAAGEPACQWRIIVTGPEGNAVAVGRLRRPRGRVPAQNPPRPPAAPGDPGPVNPSAAPGNPGPSPRSSACLIGQVTVIVPAALVTSLPRPAAGRADPLREVLSAALDTASLALAAAGPGPVPGSGGNCVHRWESRSYRPPDRLREFISARDQTCRFPGCRQPAWRVDHDHTIAFGKGGRTCVCNLGPLCRTHHQLKQRPDWQLEQPARGEFVWTAPSHRVYVIRPPKLCDPPGQAS